MSILGAIGSVVGGLFGKREADENQRMQKEFAQKGIQWRVADAKAAGIHPLAALGASTASYSPVSSGMGDAIGQGAAHLGQVSARRMEQKMAQETHRANLDLIRSETALNQSQIARSLQEATSRTRIAGATNAATGGPSRVLGSSPPEPRPFVGLRVLGTKETFFIPSSVARQLDLRNGDAVTHGVVEDLIGDVASEMLAPSFVSGFEDYSRSLGGTGIMRDAPRGRSHGPEVKRPSTGPRRSTTSIPQNLRYR